MRVFYGCLLFRLSCALLICTSFVPDEYYQGVEPAYRSVYGKGIVTWEWEDGYRLRSFLGILPYMALFKVFKELGVHSQWLHAVGPRLVQAVFASVADACLYRIASSHSAVTGQWTMMLHLGNWYWTYSATRTLANTNEACVFIVVLYLWCYSTDAGGGRAAKQYAALALLCLQCYARPTSALLFLPLLVDRLLIMLKQENMAGAVRYCGSCVVVGVLCVALGVCIDTYSYHHFHHEQGSTQDWVWTVTPSNFYAINVHARVSSLFGIHPWHWNATSGLPIVLGLAFPALCVAVGWYVVGNGGKMMMERRKRRINGSGLTYTISTYTGSTEAAGAVKLAVIAVVLYPLGLHVFSAHQEIRFLAPVLPAAHLVLGVAIEEWRSQGEGSKQEGDVKPQLSQSSSCRCRQRSSRQQSKTMVLKVLMLVGVVHSMAALYLLTRHQRGPEWAARTIVELSEAAAAAAAARRKNGDECLSSSGSSTPVTVLMLAPCYTFPGYSFHHTGPRVDLRLIASQCSPFDEPPHAESVRFTDSPLAFYRSLARNGKRGSSDEIPGEEGSDGLLSKPNPDLPDIIVTFDCYAEHVKNGYAIGNNDSNSNNGDDNNLCHMMAGDGYVLERTFPHADFRYDFDTSFEPRRALVLRR